MPLGFFTGAASAWIARRICSAEAIGSMRRTGAREFGIYPVRVRVELVLAARAAEQLLEIQPVQPVSQFLASAGDASN